MFVNLSSGPKNETPPHYGILSRDIKISFAVQFLGP